MYRIPSVTLVGHPFSPIGTGEHIRSVFRSFREIGMLPKLRNVYELECSDEALHEEFGPYLTDDIESEIAIFCLNGDEILPALEHMQHELQFDRFNIVYPNWELPLYPSVWGQQLSKFNEVWTASQFTAISVSASVDKPVVWLPLPAQCPLSKSYGRRHFGIPEAPFVFLFVFDFSSYVQRKNPFAVCAAFEEFCRRSLRDDVILVIKTKGGESRPPDYEAFCDYTATISDRITIIDGLMTDAEAKSLLRCSDAFISLHRSEGFGFGLANAMFFGKPVIATAYSGNTDFMSSDDSCLVRYELEDVPNGAYPYYEGQVWATPNVEDAVQYMCRLVSDRSYAARIGTQASRHMRVGFSYRATGLKYVTKLQSSLHEAAS